MCQSQWCSSEKLCSSSGSLVLYTNSCRSQFDYRQIIKFADDSVIMSLLKGGEVDHGPVVNDFVTWCKESCLELNVSKTKDMVVDFRSSAPALTPQSQREGGGTSGELQIQRNCAG